MDSDGEDLPEDIFNLVESFEKKGRKMAVFAKRAKRSESWLFKLCYRAYLFSNWLFIGKIFKVGNFSIIPYDYLAPLVVSAELWNHYAATVFKLRLPVDLLPISRGVRLHGKSKMNFVSLIVHGLSAISVFGEIVGTRFFILFFSISTIFMALVVSGLLVLFSTDMTLSCHVAYGIGLILLDVSNPPESEIMIPAQERFEIDWSTCNRLTFENADFRSFITSVRHFYQTGDIKADDWD